MDKRGFTFTEVIVATVIVAILSAGMFSACVGAQYILNRERHRMQAFNFAMQALDTLKSNYQYTGSQMSIANGHLESEIGTIIRGEEMSGLSTVLTYDITEPQTDGYKALTIHVTWNEPRL